MHTIHATLTAHLTAALDDLQALEANPAAALAPSLTAADLEAVYEELIQLAHLARRAAHARADVEAAIADRELAA